MTSASIASKSKAKRGKKSALPAIAPDSAHLDDAIDEPVENCPVICADEIFLGTSGSQNLRVVCFSINPRSVGRKVS